jgi:transposase-like protein
MAAPLTAIATLSPASGVLSEEKKQQVIALGRLGLSLRRIQQATRIRRETAAGYLKAAGIAVRPPGG